MDIPIYINIENYNMIPPITTKQWLCIRSVTTVVFNEIAKETAESNLLTITQIVPSATPENMVYAIIIMYYVHSFYLIHYEKIYGEKYRQRERKRSKLEQLEKYVLTEPVYDFIKATMVVLFLLIREPKPAV
jgi:hypothetical protein